MVRRFLDLSTRDLDLLVLEELLRELDISAMLAALVSSFIAAVAAVVAWARAATRSFVSRMPMWKT